MQTCEKYTQYYVLGLLSFIAGHMIGPPIHELLLPLWLRLISCSRGCRPGGALPCEMTSQTTLETSSTSTASLSWCTLQGWSVRAGTLLQVLVGRLLHARSRRLLLRPLHLEARAWHLKVQSLRQKLRARHLHWHLHRFICGDLKNWLGYEKQGLTLLPKGCPWNDAFLLPSFSSSLILFSIIMALSTAC
jgi:hypothetical protein